MQGRHRSEKTQFEPVTVKVDLRTPQGIFDLEEELVRLLLAGKIPYQTLGAVNGSISNILRMPGWGRGLEQDSDGLAFNITRERTKQPRAIDEAVRAVLADTSSANQS